MTQKAKQATFELHAIGTVWRIEHSGGVGVEAGIRKLISDFEDEFSRFLPASQLSILNSAGRLHNPSKEFVSMLNFAVAMHQNTSGVFNVSIGSVLTKNGYGHNAKCSVLYNSLEKIRISPKLIQIPDDMYLDFGGFGKGWLVDKIGKYLSKKNVDFFVINGGGDILVHSTTPIVLGLQHPIDDSLVIGTVSVRNGALGVSSNQKRVWKKNGRSYSHIISPTTKNSPENSVVGTYITAESALIADTLATVLFIDPTQEQILSKKYSANCYIVYDWQL